MFCDYRCMIKYFNASKTESGCQFMTVKGGFIYEADNATGEPSTLGNWRSNDNPNYFRIQATELCVA